MNVFKYSLVILVVLTQILNFKAPYSVKRNNPYIITIIQWCDTIKKRKYQAHKRLNNALTTSRHHFDIILR